MSRADAVASLQAALKAYPQEGQAGVDLGGWAFADDQLATAGYARLEYRSGLGNFAKFFNGGKPFVDDLEARAGARSARRGSPRAPPPPPPPPPAPPRRRGRRSPTG